METFLIKRNKNYFTCGYKQKSPLSEYGDWFKQLDFKLLKRFHFLRTKCKNAHVIGKMSGNTMLASASTPYKTLVSASSVVNSVNVA